MGLPWWSSGKDSAPSLLKAAVQSLVGELRKTLQATWQGQKQKDTMESKGFNSQAKLFFFKQGPVKCISDFKGTELETGKYMFAVIHKYIQILIPIIFVNVLNKLRLEMQRHSFKHA